jgi:ABC-type lipoprotein release transport system permease subunit
MLVVVVVLVKKLIMNNYENKPNNEILINIKQMQIDYEHLKQKILNDYDRLLEMEKEFAKANKVIMNRLNGENK